MKTVLMIVLLSPLFALSAKAEMSMCTVRDDDGGFVLKNVEVTTEKTVCNLEVGTDDGNDLAPDDIFAMFDENGKPLSQIELGSGQFQKIELRSDVIIARAMNLGSCRQKEVQLGINVPGVGPIFQTSELSEVNEVVELELDLRSSDLRKKLGKIYDGCEDEKGRCSSNVVYLTCGPISKVAPAKTYVRRR